MRDIGKSVRILICSRLCYGMPDKWITLCKLRVLAQVGLYAPAG